MFCCAAICVKRFVWDVQVDPQVYADVYKKSKLKMATMQEVPVPSMSRLSVFCVKICPPKLQGATLVDETSMVGCTWSGRARSSLVEHSSRDLKRHFCGAIDAAIKATGSVFDTAVQPLRRGLLSARCTNMTWPLLSGLIHKNII